MLSTARRGPSLPLRPKLRRRAIELANMKGRLARVQADTAAEAERVWRAWNKQAPPSDTRRDLSRRSLDDVRLAPGHLGGFDEVDLSTSWTSVPPETEVLQHWERDWPSGSQPGAKIVTVREMRQEDERARAQSRSNVVSLSKPAAPRNDDELYTAWCQRDPLPGPSGPVGHIG